MGHKKYKLVEDTEIPYEHPPQDSLKSTYFYRFLSSFWWNMLQITGSIVKMTIFNMAAMKKCRKIKYGNFRKL